MSLSGDAKAAIATFDANRRPVATLSERLLQANAAILIVKERAAAGNAAAIENISKTESDQGALHPRHFVLCIDYLSEKAAKFTTELLRDPRRRPSETTANPSSPLTRRVLTNTSASSTPASA